MNAMLSRFLLRSFHSLPSRHAILLGWASELPVLVQMNSLAAQHRPKSDHPDFWAVWSGQDSDGETIERKVDWKSIADDWQQISVSAQEQGLESNDE